MINNLNKYFDHARLTPETTSGDIRQLCREAIEHSFYAVAVNPFWVKQAYGELKDSEVKILSVSGFPLSAATTGIKVAEAMQGVRDGADEIDMVANIGLLIDGEYEKVAKEISQLRKALPDYNILKVIIEAPKLSPEIQVRAAEAVIDGGADYVKTCTGFFGGATADMVKRLHEAVGDRIKIKASGGIKTLSDTIALIEAGAERIGSSSSAAIMKEYYQAAKT
jgi:deoxyribose-phosphate aldolase